MKYLENKTISHCLIKLEILSYLVYKEKEQLNNLKENMYKYRNQSNKNINYERPREEKSKMHVTQCKSCFLIK